MMARPGGTNPFCLQVFFLAGRLDRACAFWPWEATLRRPPPSQARICPMSARVFSSASWMPRSCWRHTTGTHGGYASTWDRLLMGVVWA
jgi:hypothetical protein